MTTDSEIPTTIPHSDFGDPDCWGCLNGIIRGDIAVIECNECSAVIRTVATADLEKILHENGIIPGYCKRRLRPLRSDPHTPGFSRLLAFTCDECRRGTKLSDDANIELLLR